METVAVPPVVLTPISFEVPSTAVIIPEVVASVPEVGNIKFVLPVMVPVKV